MSAANPNTGNPAAGDWASEATAAGTNVTDSKTAGTRAGPGAAGERLSTLLECGDAASPALVVPDAGQVLTYAQIATRTETLARRLAALGVRRGDRVAFALPNGPDLVLLLLAITALGAAAAPLNPAYTEAEFG